MTDQTARTRLDLLMTGVHPMTRGAALDAYRAEVLNEAATPTTAARIRLDDLTDAQLDALYAERDAFCDRVDTLTAIAKSNGRAHRIAAEECHRLTAELAATQAQLTALRAQPPGCGCDGDPIECTHQAARDRAIAERDRLGAKALRVEAMRDQWVGHGAPTIGTSISRWWDARLRELTAALNGPPAPASADDTRLIPLDIPKCPTFCPCRTTAP